VPSKDTFHEKRPELNDSIQTELASSALGRPTETVSRARRLVASPTSKRGPTPSAQVTRLASRTNSTPEALASKIPEDTLRRTKFPVIEQLDAQGRRVFKHDIGVSDGRLTT
jgi:hypothetical protein